MGSVVIVLVDPVGEGVGAGLAVVPELGVDPFFFEYPVEPFDFAVLSWAVGSDEEVFDLVVGEEGS